MSDYVSSEVSILEAVQPRTKKEGAIVHTAAASDFAVSSGPAKSTVYATAGATIYCYLESWNGTRTGHISPLPQPLWEVPIQRRGSRAYINQRSVHRAHGARDWVASYTFGKSFCVGSHSFTKLAADGLPP